MKAASIREIKQELNQATPQELLDLCLRLTKFKKENKELLTYLLFESHDEEGYIESVNAEVDHQFKQINTRNYYYVKKSVRKILRSIKTYIRYSKKKETEIALLMHFCAKMKELKPSITRNPTLNNLYDRQIVTIKKAISTLHEDLQHDLEVELQEMSL